VQMDVRGTVSLPIFMDQSSTEAARRGLGVSMTACASVERFVFGHDSSLIGGSGRRLWSVALGARSSTNLV
jgi:hypothetical protein